MRTPLVAEARVGYGQCVPEEAEVIACVERSSLEFCSLLSCGSQQTRVAPNECGGGGTVPFLEASHFSSSPQEVTLAFTLQRAS